MFLQKFGKKVSNALSIPSQLLLLIGLIAFILMPVFFNQPHVLRLLIMMNIMAVFASSWNLVTGYAGQLILGHALFFGVSAYVSAMLNTNLDWSPLVSIPAGTLAAVLTGLIAGYPALRLKGIYLGLTTLAMPVVLSGIVIVFSDFTGGEMGIVGVSLLSKNRIVFYYITLFILVLTVFAIHKITRSKTGLIFQAIRENEMTAQASGVNTTYYKLLAFCMGGLFAGLAGGLYAHFIRVVGPSVLSFGFSFEPIIWSSFGGVATVMGPVIGVFILVPAIEELRAVLGENASLVYYIILGIVVIFAPGGVIRWFLNRVEKKCAQCEATNFAFRRHCRNCKSSLKDNGVLKAVKQS